MRIIWHSVAPMVATGYGTQTRVLVRELRRRGHDVIVSATYGIGGHSCVTEDGIPVLPIGANPYRYGNDSIRQHVHRFRPDLVVTFLDVWVLDPETWRPLPWAALVPVDSDPLMERNHKALEACRWPVAMSRFGERVLKEAGFVPHYCPLCYDPAEYSPMDREEARRQLQADRGCDLTGKYIVAVTSANVGSNGRKNFPEIFKAWAEFSKRHWDARLYLHTDTTGKVQGGDDLERMARMFGCDLDTIIIPDQYRYAFSAYPAEFLRCVYNAADCYLNPSRSEGFGLPIVEAQACGCPVLVTAFAAGAELCFGGMLLEGEMQFQAGMCQQMHVGSQAIMAGLEWMYENRGNEAQRARAIEGAKTYELGRIMDEYMMPMLAAIAAEKEREETPEDPEGVLGLVMPDLSRVQVTEHGGTIETV